MQMINFKWVRSMTYSRLQKCHLLFRCVFLLRSKIRRKIIIRRILHYNCCNQWYEKKWLAPYKINLLPTCTDVRRSFAPAPFILASWNAYAPFALVLFCLLFTFHKFSGDCEIIFIRNEIYYHHEHISFAK